jgi:Lon protease-like protein
MDDILNLFPLNTVLLPGAMLQLHVFEDRYKEMMAQCIDGELPFGVLLDRSGLTAEDLDPVDVGTVAVIRKVTRLSAGRLFVIAQGTRRFRIERVLGTTPFWRAEVSFLREVDGPPASAGRLREAATLRLRDYLAALLAPRGDGIESIELPSDAAASSYLIADALQVASPVKQQLLEAGSAVERLSVELTLLDAEIERLRSEGPSESQENRLTFPARFSLN